MLHRSVLRVLRGVERRLKLLVGHADFYSHEAPCQADPAGSLRIGNVS